MMETFRNFIGSKEESIQAWCSQALWQLRHPAMIELKKIINKLHEIGNDLKAEVLSGMLSKIGNKYFDAVDETSVEFEYTRMIEEGLLNGADVGFINFLEPMLNRRHDPKIMLRVKFNILKNADIFDDYQSSGRATDYIRFTVGVSDLLEKVKPMQMGIQQYLENHKLMIDDCNLLESVIFADVDHFGDSGRLSMPQEWHYSFVKELKKILYNKKTIVGDGIEIAKDKHGLKWVLDDVESYYYLMDLHKHLHVEEGL